ncbi:SMP-30/gluconolactonase/LRE family protein [Cohaesibacter celericrescens]|uniref:Gluconolactonase n=1 Tax=Cohaesibacter celericrescens TaxID=2067669 RepID=A0A2N5XWL2_9HYPH|nr:SMP-30/gluconolactonase/LRE family protein [Cohaesibacter celericrescens]PLW78815.1 gluconolactonase [Cohaesibacter celericrescens]
MHVFDDRICILGEGPLWHPERKQLFWFDILGSALMTRVGDKQLQWDFDEHVSAAGWVDETHLLVASESALSLFDLDNGETEYVCGLESDRPENRSNDGRADPYGGFWIGTMGKQAEPGAGAIYRYYDGELRRLYKDITISNAICFTPDGLWAYFTDSPTLLVKKVALDEDGWPCEEPEVFLDLSERHVKADGAVVDTAGNIWIAHWGSSKVAAYAPDGTLLHEEPLPATQVSCPAFGGDDYSTLFATCASVNISDEEKADRPMTGAVFSCHVEFTGQKEHRVLL